MHKNGAKFVRATYSFLADSVAMIADRTAWQHL